MFDLNLIKKPGIQTKSTPKEKYFNPNNNKKDFAKADVVNNKKKYKISWAGLILISFVLFFIYMFFLAGNSRQLLFEKTYRVNSPIKINLFRYHLKKIRFVKQPFLMRFRVEIKYIIVLLTRT